MKTCLEYCTPDSTPDNIFDNTLGGTKNWQGGLNAKEPVCPAAFVYVFMLLHVYALRCKAKAFYYLCVLQPEGVPLCADVMQSELCFYSLFEDDSNYYKANNACVCCCTDTCVYAIYIYIQVVPYVPAPDTAW